jgi:hypothetical protein
MATEQRDFVSADGKHVKAKAAGFLCAEFRRKSRDYELQATSKLYFGINKRIF